MTAMNKPRSPKAPLLAVLSLLVVLPFVLAGESAALYPPDGLKSDGMGGYMNPDDGMCVIGIKVDGTMLVDWSITNARDCAAWTKAADDSVNLASMTTSDQCTKQGFAGNDGYKHTFASTLCFKDGAGLSRVDLDSTDAMCLSKGGTIVKNKCVAYGWQYRNRKADGTLPVTGTGIGTTQGPSYADGLGFCYASMRMTSATYNTAATCPSYHNSHSQCAGGSNPGTPCTSNSTCTGGGTCSTRNLVDWPDCDSTTTGCQTQASYDAGLGWSFSSSRCLYAYGAKGLLNSDATKADGTKHLANGVTEFDLTTAAYDTMGECIGNGFSWDNWLPNTSTTVEDNTGGYPGLPAGALITRLDAISSLEEGGGDFYSGTGAVCQKCHSDQSRSYQERDKPGFYKTRHKLAGDAVGKPFQPNFTEAGSLWGLQGVQCAMCHSTAKPAQDDLIQVVPAGEPGEGNPISAAGHNNTEYGTHLLDICYTCHGTAAVPESVNPASVIPVSGGELALTDFGLEPIANQFLNSPHARYTGDSTKVQVGNKDNYGSSFEGYICRTAATPFRSTTGQPGENSTTCAAAGYTWYMTTNNGNICYYSETQCTSLLPTGQWVTTFDPAVYPWAADANGPGGVCAGIGIGSIITTVYRAGEAEKIHNLDSTTNEACTNAPDGSSESGAGGFWVKDGETTDGFPTDTAQGNCMTCHDVHWALADDAPHAEPIRRECTTCHINPGVSASDAPQVDIATINHLGGTGTPLVNQATDPSESCITCHMPKSGGPDSDTSRLHLWRISKDPTYETMGATQVNTVSGKARVDLDLACGQCHGGGTVQDAEHMPAPPALYRTATELAGVALGMHDAAGVSYPVTFTSKVTGLKVDVVAIVNCGMPCPAFTYGWVWGDGSTNTEAVPATDHTYATYGKKTVNLTVRLDGKIVGSVSRFVTVAGNDADLPPVASATCDFDEDTWTVTVTDTSTDTDFTPVQTVAADWNDESGRSVGGAGSTLVHTYIEPGSYTVEFQAIDSALKSSTVDLVCTPPVAPAYFTISGTIFESDGTTPVPNANVVVKQGRVRVVRVKTAVDGTFTAGSLRPGTYKLKVRKSGFAFAIPAATKTVGPDSVGNAILAISEP